MPFIGSGLGGGIGGDDDSVAETPIVGPIIQLFPQGKLWRGFALATLVRSLATAIADAFWRVVTRGEDLVNEADPRTATEMLPDWENAFGLPDAAITSIPSTPDARRLAIFQKLVGRGGQTPAYFQSLALACGYSVTIDDSYTSRILRVGCRVGDRCYGSNWAYAWRVYVTAPVGAALTHAELEAIIRRAAPAHTIVIFNYL